MPAEALSLPSKVDDERSDALVWLPTIVSRPVLPLEVENFCAEKQHAIAAVKRCWANGWPLAAIAAMPVRDGCKDRLGTALRLQMVEELPSGALMVRAIGLWPFSVLEESVQPVRPDILDGTQTQATMVNLVRTRQLPDSEPVKERGQSCATLRKRVRVFLGGSNMTASWAEGSDADFSWHAAARLPLPAVARGVLLHIRSVEERLSICSQVLAASFGGSVAELQGEGLTVGGPFRSRL
mmetsp:Transcript_131597/g.328202  ORF Transcript_131597/g.328202 Transcript_131597/m.328202 type:complete len:239 (+) Transcript_131597:50-766(+)